MLSIPYVFSSLGPPVIPSGVKWPVTGIKLFGEGDSGTSGTVSTLRNFLWSDDELGLLLPRESGLISPFS